MVGSYNPQQIKSHAMHSIPNRVSNLMWTEVQKKSGAHWSCGGMMKDDISIITWSFSHSTHLGDLFTVKVLAINEDMKFVLVLH